MEEIDRKKALLKREQRRLHEAEVALSGAKRLTSRCLDEVRRRKEHIAWVESDLLPLIDELKDLNQQ